jgi:hypothetical protein
MLALMLLALGLGQDPAAAAPERAPMHRTGLPTNRPPVVTAPSREEFAQVTLFCTVRRPDRLDDCRIVRQWPETSRFGAMAVRRVNGFRLTRGSAIPGDTFEFDLWFCSGEVTQCRRRPWPETPDTPAD